MMKINKHPNPKNEGMLQLLFCCTALLMLGLLAFGLYLISDKLLNNKQRIPQTPEYSNKKRYTQEIEKTEINEKIPDELFDISSAKYVWYDNFEIKFQYPDNWKIEVVTKINSEDEDLVDTQQKQIISISSPDENYFLNIEPTIAIGWGIYTYNPQTPLILKYTYGSEEEYTLDSKPEIMPLGIEGGQFYEYDPTHLFFSQRGIFPAILENNIYRINEVDVLYNKYFDDSIERVFFDFGCKWQLEKERSFCKEFMNQFFSTFERNDCIYNDAHFYVNKDKPCWDRLEIQEADIGSFEAIGGHFAKDKNYIYFGFGYGEPFYYVIKEADPETFRSEGIIGRDANGILFGYDYVSTDNPSSFEIIPDSNTFAKDDDNVFFLLVHEEMLNLVRLKDIDPQTFEIIEFRTFKDKNGIYEMIESFWIDGIFEDKVYKRLDTIE
jgi:hypothetical protein